MPDSSFSVDAVIDPRGFTVDAWILGERQKHHRIRDHYGAESDLFVVLDSNIGKYAEGTPVHIVLADMVARMFFLEDYNRKRASFTVDAWLAISGTYGQGIIPVDAVVEKTITFTGSEGIKIDAVLTAGGSFTVDAIIVSRFTVDAFIV